MVLPTTSQGITHTMTCFAGGVPPRCGAEGGRADFYEEFLRAFKPLECECCEGIVGFVERATGRVMCKPYCMPQDGGPKTIEKVLMRCEVAAAHTEPVAEVAPKGPVARQEPVAEVAPKGPVARQEPVAEVARKEPVARQEPVPPVAAVARRGPVARNEPEAEVSRMEPVARQEPVPPVAAVARKEPVVEGDRAPAMPKLPNLCSSKNFVWKRMKYSINLLPGMSMRVTFSWSVNKYHLVSAADADSLGELDRQIAKYIEACKNCGPSIQRRPQPGDIVLAMYGAGGGGDFYRARVVVSTPEGVQVDFIDYGDSELVSYKNIYEINEDLFSDPIYGLTVRLKGIPDGDYRGMPVPVQLEDLENGNFVLDLADEIEPDNEGVVEGNLWFQTDSICDVVYEHLVKEGRIQKNAGKSYGFKIRCSKSYVSLLDFMFPSTSIKNVKKDVLKASEFQKTVAFDVHSYSNKYFLNSVPTWQENPGKKITVEIGTHDTSHYGTNLAFSCVQLAPDWIVRRKFLSQLIRSYIFQRYRKGEGNMKSLRAKITPERDQMFLVKYPTWGEVMVSLKSIKGQKDLDEIIRRGFYDDYMHKCGKQYVGQWFRGAFVRVIARCNPSKPELAVFNLIDVGRLMIIPAKYVYAITPRFLIPPQLSLNIAINIDGIPQYSLHVENWLKTILTPGRRIEIKTIASIADITMALVVNPILSLEDFAKWQVKYDEAEVRKEIEGKIKELINNTLDVSDVDKVKEEVQKLLNQCKSEYEHRVASNTHMYGTDTKRARFRAGGYHLSFMSLKPEEHDAENVVQNQDEKTVDTQNEEVIETQDEEVLDTSLVA